MQKRNLKEISEFGERGFAPKVLANGPEYRLVLVNIRAGESVPEHATEHTATVYAISGHIRFYEKGVSADLRAGEVLWTEAGAPHRLEALEDSALLVVAAGRADSAELELDLRAVERVERHPLIFAKFDALAVGESFVLANDHDPIPLHRQMEAMRPSQLTWEYITRGPEIFRIRVRRTAPPNGSEVPFVARKQTLEQIQAR